MRTLLGSLIFVAATVVANPVNAATLVSFDSCSAPSLCGVMSLSATLNGSSIDVSITAAGDYGVFGRNGANRAFGFNVAGSESGLTISNLSGGFTFAGTDINLGGGFGTFEYVINGPQTGSGALLPLSFTVSRTDGFTSEWALFENNLAGYMFAGHLRNNDTGETGFVAATGVPVNAVVPEPASMVLLGSGLAMLLRRARKRNA